MNYYLAVDIGASSGRHILAHLENGKIILEEVHRFQNGMVNKSGHLVWDHEALFHEIILGMKKCKDLGRIPHSMGIDTWAVDYALLDENDNLLGPIYGYRDSRTQNIDQEVYKIISEENLYMRTGIQKQLFNTIYQLMAHKMEKDSRLHKAKSMLLVPDYFHFLLTGKKVAEYTNASTSQLVSPETKDWDYELINQLGYPTEIFKEIKLPGSRLGSLRAEIQEQVGFDCQVVLPPTHDTASAVVAVPDCGQENDFGKVLYISSGTWSLMGTELQEANCSKESMQANLTNEGGYHYRFRYLKNIMGMWMINSARKELAADMSFASICEQASSEQIESIVDVNANRFLAPKSMVEEIKMACAEASKQVPTDMSQVAAVIYNSLAKCYADTVKEIERIAGVNFDRIHVVGGGANASYLNQLTARACGIPVYAGPIEATALGNIVVQMIAAKELDSLRNARQCIFNSFEIKKYES